MCFYLIFVCFFFAYESLFRRVLYGTSIQHRLYSAEGSFCTFGSANYLVINSRMKHVSINVNYWCVCMNVNRVFPSLVASFLTCAVGNKGEVTIAFTGVLFETPDTTRLCFFSFHFLIMATLYMHYSFTHKEFVISNISKSLLLFFKHHSLNCCTVTRFSLQMLFFFLSNFSHQWQTKNFYNDCLPGNYGGTISYHRTTSSWRICIPTPRNMVLPVFASGVFDPHGLQHLQHNRQVLG